MLNALNGAELKLAMATALNDFVDATWIQLQAAA